VEYDSFSYRFDVNVGLDVDLCVEYKSFYFDLIISDLLFESHKSVFVEFETILTENLNLKQTLAHFDIKKLMDLGPTFRRPHIPADKISRTMTHLLANFEYVYLFPN